MEENKQEKYQSPVRATITGIADLFKKQTPVGKLNPQDRLDGKTVVVDGASSGLGFAIATEVAKLGARTVMVCRSGIPQKGEKVKELSGNPDVHMLHVDFTDARSIEKVSGEIREKFAPVDILISNAGVVPNKSRKTPQGLEEMFMVNYFSKFLYINSLLENGSIGNHGENGRTVPRIIIVSSESHRNPKEINWTGFGKDTPYGMKQSMEHYGHNKLLLTAFAVELSRRLNAGSVPGIPVFALCPGPVNSNIAREMPALFSPLLKLVFKLFFRSPKDASQPVLYFAASPDVEGKPFDYLFLMNRKEVDSKALDPDNGRKLWELSSALRKKM